MRVRFCSPVKSHMGYAELGRITINQLLAAGFDVSVVEIPIQGSNADFGELGAQAERLVGKDGVADVNIVNMIPPRFADYRLPGARNIGYSMFEADRIPDDWVLQCNAMDAMWVPAEWVREVFIASGVTVPVSVVGVDAIPVAPAPPPPGPFRFLSVFQWTARKNPVALIRAYAAAFDGSTDTVLTLKIHRHSDPAQNRTFAQNAVNAVLARCKPRKSIPRIEVATDFFSSAQMRQLHADSHAYVSLAHAEGWGLPAWEATLAGKPVIHTGWSAPMEFVHEQGRLRFNLSPSYGMQEFVPFYHSAMNWAEPHLDHAIEKLRDARGNYPAWSNTALEHRETVNEKFALARRVEQLRQGI